MTSLTKYIHVAAVTIGLLLSGSLFAGDEKKDNVRITLKVSSAKTLEKDNVSLYIPALSAQAPQPLKIVDGKVVIHTHIPAPLNAMILTGKPLASFVIEPGEYQGEITDEGLTFKGGPINQIVHGYRYTKSYEDMQQRSRDYNQEAAKIDPLDKEAMAASRSKGGALYFEFMNAPKEHFQALQDIDQPDLAKLLAAAEGMTFAPDPEALKEQFGESMANDPSYQLTYLSVLAMQENNAKNRVKLAELQATDGKIEVGTQYKDIAGLDLDGKEHKLSDALGEGKYVLMDIWASWCGPCRAEFPHLKSAYKKYHDRGLDIFAVSIDSDRGDWIDAMEEEDTPWLNYLDQGNDVSDIYGVAGIPYNVLIDENGIIVGKQLRGHDMDERLDELLPSSK